MDLALRVYRSASCQHRAKLLADHHQIPLGAKSIARILRAAGIPLAHSHKAARRRRSRDRMTQAGALVQVDASSFAWLEDRGPTLWLHGAIDDATGQILGLWWLPTEQALGHLQVLHQVLQRHGVPARLYSDRHTLFSGIPPTRGELQRIAVQVPFVLGQPACGGLVSRSMTTLTRRVWVASALGALATGASGCVAESVRVVSADEASRALSAARSRLGDRYLWGGQSPAGFDCSGLVLWAYAQALGRLRLRRPDGELVADATMHQIYGWHCIPIAAEEARPGDVLAIAAEDSAVVTHGGLVEVVRDDEVAFVNASSYHGRVVSDVWPFSGSKRQQRIVGFGRLLVAERYLFGLVRL